MNTQMPLKDDTISVHLSLTMTGSRVYEHSNAT